MEIKAKYNQVLRYKLWKTVLPVSVNVQKYFKRSLLIAKK